MKKRWFFSVGVFFAVTSSVYAQTPPPAALWPPDPENIFTDQVDWQIASGPDAVRGPFVDHDKRVIRLFDSVNYIWQEVAFPDEVEDVRAAT